MSGTSNKIEMYWRLIIGMLYDGGIPKAKLVILGDNNRLKYSTHTDIDRFEAETFAITNNPTQSCYGLFLRNPPNFIIVC